MASKTKHRLAARPAFTVKTCATLSKTSQPTFLSQKNGRFFCVLVRRVMPRRGWVPTPDGWVQFIRGPRPPAERWPESMRAASTGASKPQVQGQAMGRGRQSENPPIQTCLPKSRLRLRRSLKAAVTTLAAVGTGRSRSASFVREPPERQKRSSRGRGSVQQLVFQEVVGTQEVAVQLAQEEQTQRRRSNCCNKW